MVGGGCWVRSNPLLSKVSLSVKNPISLLIKFVRVEYFNEFRFMSNSFIPIYFTEKSLL